MPPKQRCMPAPSWASSMPGCTARSAQGSVCDDATVYGREHGITVIDGGCPLMFEPTADVGHKVMRFVFTRTGKVPRTCEAPTVTQGICPASSQRAGDG